MCVKHPLIQHVIWFKNQDLFQFHVTVTDICVSEHACVCVQSCINSFMTFLLCFYLFFVLCINDNNDHITNHYLSILSSGSYYSSVCSGRISELLITDLPVV